MHKRCQHRWFRWVTQCPGFNWSKFLLTFIPWPRTHPHLHPFTQHNPYQENPPSPTTGQHPQQRPVLTCLPQTKWFVTEWVLSQEFWSWDKLNSWKPPLTVASSYRVMLRPQSCGERFRDIGSGYRRRGVDTGLRGDCKWNILRFSVELKFFMKKQKKTLHYKIFIHRYFHTLSTT